MEVHWFEHISSEPDDRSCTDNAENDLMCLFHEGQQTSRRVTGHKYRGATFEEHHISISIIA